MTNCWKIPLLLLLALPACSLRGQQDLPCFTPLLDTKHPLDASQWSSLSSRSLPLPPVLADKTGFVRFQALGDTAGPINLDFYTIEFEAAPGNPRQSAVEIYNNIRKAFPTLARSTTAAGELGFLPYRDMTLANTNGTDAVAKNNRDRWESANPEGAMMTFLLANHPYTALTLNPSQIGPVFETASVVAVCASKLNFIFATATSDGDGLHPVTGYRGFGLLDEGGGKFKFYAMGTDRETFMRTGTISYPGTPNMHPYPGNVALRLGFVPGVPAGEDAVFIAGDQFWIQFFHRLQDYLAERHYVTKPYPFDHISNRFAYPSMTPLPAPSPLP